MKVKRYGIKTKKPFKFNLQMILITAAAALLLAAAAVFFTLYNEGVSAGKNADALLAKSGIKENADHEKLLPLAQGQDNYIQPDAPETPSVPSDIFAQGLQGYTVIARLDIDTINQHLPVLSETSAKALKISVCYFSGPMPDEDGNLVITGHNYANGAHFGKLDQVKVNDTVSLTDGKGSTYTYSVYKTGRIRPDEAQALQDNAYPRELTLVTCEKNGNRRLVVRCKLNNKQ